VRQHAPHPRGGGPIIFDWPNTTQKIKIKPQIKYIVISMPPLGCLYRLQEIDELRAKVNGIKCGAIGNMLGTHWELH